MKSPRLSTWLKLQARELQEYRKAYKEKGSYLGFFSVPERRDVLDLKPYISDRCDNCLDVGSGILPRPAYMPDDVKMFGLDPFSGEYRREYDFAQAIGEHLPFPNDTFDCVAFMSSLDHQIEPLVSLREARRVMIDNGFLFIWNALRYEDSHRYLAWKKLPPGTTIDSHHQYAFTLNDVIELLEKAGFSYKEYYDIARRRFHTKLVIGQK
jgi:SAM-dependent methyltransferase